MTSFSKETVLKRRRKGLQVPPVVSEFGSEAKEGFDYPGILIRSLSKSSVVTGPRPDLHRSVSHFAYHGCKDSPSP